MTKYKIVGWDDSINNAVLFTPWSLIHFLSGYIGMIYVNYFKIILWQLPYNFSNTTKKLYPR